MNAEKYWYKKEQQQRQKKTLVIYSLKQKRKKQKQVNLAEDESQKRCKRSVLSWEKQEFFLASFRPGMQSLP